MTSHAFTSFFLCFVKMCIYLVFIEFVWSAEQKHMQLLGKRTMLLWISKGYVVWHAWDACNTIYVNNVQSWMTFLPVSYPKPGKFEQSLGSLGLCFPSKNTPPCFHREDNLYYKLFKTMNHHRWHDLAFKHFSFLAEYVYVSSFLQILELQPDNQAAHRLLSDMAMQRKNASTQTKKVWQTAIPIIFEGQLTLFQWETGTKNHSCPSIIMRMAVAHVWVTCVICLRHRSIIVLRAFNCIKC